MYSNHVKNIEKNINIQIISKNINITVLCVILDFIL